MQQIFDVAQRKWKPGVHHHRRAISGDVLKYRNGDRCVIHKCYKTARPGSTRFLLTLPVEQVVTVTADGFEWQGRPYKSLSAIARAITGTRWNGWVFFGLKNHRRGA